MTDQPVIVSEADGIITITLNRPEAKNAVNKALAEGVSNALDKLESDPLIMKMLTYSPAERITLPGTHLAPASVRADSRL